MNSFWNTLLKKNKRIILCCLVIFSSTSLFAQKKDSVYDANKTIVINNNKFKVYNNWISGGAGEINNFTREGYEFTLGADFNFHIQSKYFQMGFCFSGQDLNIYKDYDYHFAFGKRIENPKYNFAFFLGPAYATGFIKENGTYTGGKLYNKLSLYGCIQMTKKIKYDVGIGPSLFFDINQYQNMAGIRLDIYLSGAYKGKEHKDKFD